MKRVEDLEREFGRLYGAEPERVFFAPGRVNLIGEHTDYNGGHVFPAALTFGTLVAVRARKDGRFRLASRQFANRVEVGVGDVVYRKEDGWANFPKGVLHQFLACGVHLSGCDMLFDGDVPLGAGLSSSASIELAAATAIAAVSGLSWPMIRLVQLAQQAENQFVGVKCGIMDPFASGMGKADHAILLHCDTLDYRHVPLRLGDYRLAIVHTNKSRGLAGSKYNERRQECEAGLRELQRALPGVKSLGEVRPEEWERVQGRVSSERLRRRIRHVVTENDRVLRSAEALESGDLPAFGRLMRESHLSLQRDYEVTGPELDALFDEAIRVEGCIGARMTGAGFGGCTVNLVHRDALEEFRRRVEEGYRRRTGLTPRFYCPGIGDGAREIHRGEK